jgi:hypothetical protein
VGTRPVTKGHHLRKSLREGDFAVLPRAHPKGHDSCTPEAVQSVVPSRGGPIRTFAVSLIGAAALAAGLVLIRNQKNLEALPAVRDVPAGETVPSTISLDRLRASGY